MWGNSEQHRGKRVRERTGMGVNENQREKQLERIYECGGDKDIAAYDRKVETELWRWRQEDLDQERNRETEEQSQREGNQEQELTHEVRQRQTDCKNEVARDGPRERETERGGREIKKRQERDRENE